MNNSIDYNRLADSAKRDSVLLASSAEKQRNGALASIAKALEDGAEAIFEANRADMADAAADNLPQPIVSRLKFDEDKLSDCIKGIQDLIGLPDPLFRTLLRRELDDGLLLERITCPIGVIGVIFESRPDALIQISSLCIKSGNCSILKGGSEAKRTNRVLFDIIHEAGVSAGLPEGFTSLVEAREGIDALLGCHDKIDLIIPRGSNAFVQYIMNNSQIPVMGHADGICHVYVDKSADIQQAVRIITDAKTQYPAACNAAETLLIHEDIYERVMDALADAPFEMRFGEDGYSREYLDYILNVRKVTSMDEAIEHINHYGSHHTDVIVTADDSAASRFMLLVDSAGVYHNCSSRFADGFRYGFGAEVGISTGKLHARGPVGLEGLVTYKYLLHGSGQIVADYAEGRSAFRFRDL